MIERSFKYHYDELVCVIPYSLFYIFLLTVISALKSSFPDRYIGSTECQDEMMRYLVEVEGLDVQDKLCSSLMAHLEQNGEFRIMNG